MFFILKLIFEFITLKQNTARMKVSYVTDRYGKQSAVIIPIGEWNDFLDRFSKLERKLEILTGLETAVEEVNMVKEGKTQLKTLKEFLDEN